jgi:protocatechuate 3,4-dioxygenase beta subunit
MNEPTMTPSRRQALRLLGGAGVGLVAAACSTQRLTSGTTTTAGDASTTTSTSPTTQTTAATTAVTSCSTIPEETAGPYPGDGSNGPNALTDDGIVRSDIRSSFGSSTGTAEGIPLAVELLIVDTARGCAPYAGAAVYVWHCDRDGNYSMYSNGVTDENYLRGVQAADADGRVAFTTIFPGCYSGRWPHIHFEVYPTLADATRAEGKIATSQLALPKNVCDAAYATNGYASSATNLSRTSLATDMVFRDGADTETPSVTGSPDAGYVAALTVGV